MSTSKRDPAGRFAPKGGRQIPAVVDPVVMAKAAMSDALARVIKAGDPNAIIDAAQRVIGAFSKPAAEIAPPAPDNWIDWSTESEFEQIGALLTRMDALKAAATARREAGEPKWEPPKRTPVEHAATQNIAEPAGIEHQVDEPFALDDDEVEIELEDEQ